MEDKRPHEERERPHGGEPRCPTNRLSEAIPGPSSPVKLPITEPCTDP